MPDNDLRLSQPATPVQDSGPPDPVETDPATLSSAEDLDEDRLGLDPLDQGIEPPERWWGANRYGTTPREESEPAPLDQRLSEEEPDPVAQATQERAPDEAAYDLDYQPEPDVQHVGGDLDVDLLGRLHDDDAVRRGQAADEAGGSVAEAMREEGAPDGLGEDELDELDELDKLDEPDELDERDEDR